MSQVLSGRRNRVVDNGDSPNISGRIVILIMHDRFKTGDIMITLKNKIVFRIWAYVSRNYYIKL